MKAGKVKVGAFSPQGSLYLDFNPDFWPVHTHSLHNLYDPQLSSVRPPTPNCYLNIRHLSTACIIVFHMQRLTFLKSLFSKPTKKQVDWSMKWQSIAFSQIYSFRNLIFSSFPAVWIWAIYLASLCLHFLFIGNIESSYQSEVLGRVFNQWARIFAWQHMQ